MIGAAAGSAGMLAAGACVGAAGSTAVDPHAANTTASGANLEIRGTSGFFERRVSAAAGPRGAARSATGRAMRRGDRSGNATGEARSEPVEDVLRKDCGRQLEATQTQRPGPSRSCDPHPASPPSSWARFLWSSFSTTTVSAQSPPTETDTEQTGVLVGETEPEVPEGGSIVVSLGTSDEAIGQSRIDGVPIPEGGWSSAPQRTASGDCAAEAGR
ncbi:MAG: hypothetical protein R2715_21835 [Ilumatobacteraceae bacterium]